MRSFPRILIWFVLAFASAGTVVCAQTPLPDLQQQATALGADLFAHSSSTGMVLVVVRDHETYLRGFGETAPGSGVAPTQDSLLRLCSLSKIFATDLLIKLEHDGSLHLDDPLQKFAPPHIIVPQGAAGSELKDKRSITLLDLATHTAGLPREVGTAPRGTPHLTFPGYAYRWKWLPKQRLRTAPGTVALYSNIGFDLLGDALQKAAHKPYAQLFYERTTQPLGMRETGFTPNPVQCARLLQGAHDEGPCTDTQSSAGSAGVYSTGADMTRWLEYLLGTGPQGFPAQTHDAQAAYIDPRNLKHQQGLDHAGDPTSIGLGWMLLQPEGDPAAIVEKTGGGAGFVTYIAMNPAHHTAVFFAMTDGATSDHYNVFKGANNLLLQLVALPPTYDPSPPKPAPRKAARKAKARARHSR